MTSNEVSTCSGLRGRARGYLLLRNYVSVMRSAVASLVRIRYMRRVISHRKLGIYSIPTLCQILNHYDRSNPLSPKLSHPDLISRRLELFAVALHCTVLHGHLSLTTKKTSTGTLIKFYYKCNQITQCYPFPATSIYEEQLQRLRLGAIL